ncbi:MAG: hypothetical protein CMO33_09925 [Verrucomicrobia bacterium]|nr:hypothetical protein [Verrucomicrobiota bacterium]
MRSYAFGLFFGWVATASYSGGTEVGYNKDVRKILSANCFSCHGQDAKSRKGGLRLDDERSALEPRDGVSAIVPGDLNASEAWQRIITKDTDELMPPPVSKKTLSPEELDILKRWIEQGAKYESHWSFIEPKKPIVPQDSANPIDYFLQKRLKEEGLKPGRLAEPEILVRRLFLDLTGLPPTPQDVESYIADQSDSKLQKLINNLMRRKTYGEHMARYWLDLARYADTHGLHLDNERSMWPYRDWVVRAFNENLSFDDFTRWQIAGDLLPEATMDQKIASGFNRCNVTTGEGGSIAKEWIYRNAVDRTSTAVEVWMGLTAGCAVCHDHKYDPISTKEYYSMYAFFHSAADPALDGNKLDTPPVLRVPRPGDNDKISALAVKIKAAEKRISQTAGKINYLDPAELDEPPSPITKETVWIEDDFPPKATRQGNVEWKSVVKPEPVFSGTKAFVLEASGLQQLVLGGANPPLIIEEGMKLFAHVYLDTLNPPKEIMLQFNDGNWEHRAYWGQNKIEWGKNETVSRRRIGDLPQTGKWVRLEVEAAHIGLKPGAKVNGWAYTHFDGKAYWDKSGASVTKDPTTDPFLSWSNWKGLKENERNKDLPEELRKLVKGKPPSEWSEANEKRIFLHWLGYLSKGGNESLQALREEKGRLTEEQKEIRKNIAVTFIMADLPKPRPSFVMLRGQYDQPGEKVSRNVPSFLPSLPSKSTDRDYNRLDFANWLVSGKHPLTARVVVNRIWQQFFGTGIVKTSADFGTQGDLPSHPELLDWLSVQFVEDGWDIQRLITRILTSHAYQQSSSVDEYLLEKDPDNRLLARGPRHRLDAEVIRDQVLSLSGLLVPTMGGRGVMPYQPPNIWEPVGFASSNTRNYKQGKGDDLYRRSLYTFLKRTAPPPFMSSFDGPNREQSCSARSRSNTPMQALQLLNDVQHVEAARNLAQRILREGGEDDESRIKWAWQVVTARRADIDEAKVVIDTLNMHRSRFSNDDDSAKKLISFGDTKADPKFTPSELAAWTLVSNLMLNLDEVVNKN